jgi:YggT family protein
MSAPLLFIVETLFDLYVLCFVLRLVMQITRADFHNPLAQFIVRVTNPLLVPLRKIVPGYRGYDLAAILLILSMEVLATTALFALKTGAIPNPGALLYFALLRTLVTIIRLYLFAILIFAVLSFVSPGTYNPLSSMLASICEPVLRPFRRLIPPIGGIDLSPLFALLILQALLMTIRIPAVLV